VFLFWKYHVNASGFHQPSGFGLCNIFSVN
jgi:hypothetical protein